MAAKIWCRPWSDEPQDWSELDLDYKTLTDFRCEECGHIHRLLLSFREFAQPRTCSLCGGHLVTREDQNIISQIMKLSRRRNAAAQGALSV